MAQKLTHAGAAETDGNVLKLENTGAIAIQITGAGTYNLVPEATVDDPTDKPADAVWVGVKPFDLVAQAVLTAWTAPGIAYIDLPGFGGFRVRQVSGTGTPVSLINEALET
jgi:hypothetical protein